MVAPRRRVGLGERVSDARILVLGGTREGRELAHALAAAGFTPVTSLAGRTRDPGSPGAAAARIGGFGGVDGLAAWLSGPETAPRAVVDATHPYATRMSANAVSAAARSGVPLLRLHRPGWGERPDAVGWHWVADHEAAATAARTLGRRPFLTIGRQRLPSYAGPLGVLPVLARVADLPADETDPWPQRWTVLADRGPFALDAELALLAEHRIDVLVTKDSGGQDTVAKLDAAARRGVPVVILRRPPPPPGVPTVPDVAGALGWCAAYR